MILIVTLILSAYTLRADDVRPPTNPALLYWQAFSSLEDLSTDESKLLSDFLNRPSLFDKVKAAALLSKREVTLSRFRKATDSVADCDWGLSYEEGPHLPLPHLSRVQNLCRLSLLKVELLFAEDKKNEARDWLLAIHRAARHCGSGDLILPVLTQFQLEQAAIRATGRHVLDWDSVSRLEYLSKWKALPPLHTVKDAIKGELHFIEWLENFWLQGVGLQIPPYLSGDGTLPDIDQVPMTAEERAQAEKVVAQFSSENIRKWIHEMREIYLKMQIAVAKPWLEGKPALLALQSEYKRSDNLLMRMAIPMPLDKINDLAFKTDTCNTMLKAALEHGPLLDENQISAYKDAYLGAPLILQHSTEKTLTLSLSPEAFKKIGTRIELTLSPPEKK